jgi:hypothetical protein
MPVGARDNVAVLRAQDGVAVLKAQDNAHAEQRWLDNDSIRNESVRLQ